jgi:hypothetical protein
MLSNTAHGTYSLTHKDHIIEVTLTGAFNEYGVIDWTNAVKEIIASFNGEKFCILMDLTNALGGTPEAFEQSNLYNSWLNSQNMVAKAVVFKNKVMEDIERVMVSAKRFQHMKNFNDITEARVWLVEQLEQS